MLLLTLVQYTPLTESMVTDTLLQIMPDTGEFRNFFLNIIQEVYGKSTAFVPISVLLTLWSAGKGVQALTNGVNAIYHVHETRNYFIMRIRSAFYTLIFILSVIGTLVLLVFGNSIQKMLTKYIPVLAKVTGYIIGMRTVVSILFLVIVFLLIYKILPNRKTALKNQFPGAMISAVAWSLFSLGFSIYLDVYDGFSDMYGSLTTIILVLLWLYFCMFIILIGAEINAYFEERFKKLHKIAADKIKSEYREFIEGFRENDDDDDEDSRQGSGEARQARH
jgi:membrane protein